jgi:hypothetical protein
VLAPRRWLRLLGALACLGFAIFGLDRLLYRLEAGPEALSSRGLLGLRVIPWREVDQVQTGPDTVAVAGRGGVRIQVRTSGFGPDQRASLERTIARRVREAQDGGGTP